MPKFKYSAITKEIKRFKRLKLVYQRDQKEG